MCDISHSFKGLTKGVDIMILRLKVKVAIQIIS
jgi:hypothetical protein